MDQGNSRIAQGEPSWSGGRAPAKAGGERNFHDERRGNETHASTTDPDARLYRKGPGQPAQLAYMGHVMMGPVIAEWLASVGSSPSPPLPTTWCVCSSYCA